MFGNNRIYKNNFYYFQGYKFIIFKAIYDMMIGSQLK